MRRLIREGKMRTQKKSRVGTRTILIVLAVATTAAVGAPPGKATGGDMWVTTNTTLTEDHYGQILVRADGVTLNCAGHHIFGPGFAGVDLKSVTGVTVKNCNVSGHKVGFFISSSPNNRLL